MMFGKLFKNKFNLNLFFLFLFLVILDQITKALIINFFDLYESVSLFIKTQDKVFQFTLTLILSGALGNFIDRIFRGFVIDFIDIYIGKYHWPAFNIADSCITVGFVILMMNILFLNKKL